VGRRARPEKRPLDINEFIRASMDSLRRMVEEDKEIALELQEGLPPVMADEAQLYQVLMNLVVNARDAMPEGGRITIRTGYSNSPSINHRPYMCILKGPDSSNSGYVWFSVEDTGTGIQDENISHLFDPFYTTKGAEGTGLGLSVVYSIVQSHDGCIDLWTEPDSGTEFVILLPAIPEETRETVSHALKESPSERVSLKRVLVVDDEEVVRDVLENFFKSKGIEVVTASNGEEALRVYKEDKETFDLVIIDWVLPVVSGQKIIKEIIKMSPGQRIIVSTGYAEDEKLAPLIEQPNISILKKPFKLSEIDKLVQ
jgi:CheY-like chemotaxis protein